MARKTMSFCLGVVVLLVLFTGLSLTATHASSASFTCTKSELSANGCHTSSILKNTVEAVLDEDDVFEASETAPLPGHRNKKGHAL